MNRLKQVSAMFVEVAKKYDMLSMRRDSIQNADEKTKIESEMNKLKDQIIYLLTAIKKLVEQENV